MLAEACIRQRNALFELYLALGANRAALAKLF
jgi:hypothetical protein